MAPSNTLLGELLRAEEKADDQEFRELLAAGTPLRRTPRREQ
jgi:hypothetical protein